MRRKINPKMKQFLLEKGTDKTVSELLPLINVTFRDNYTKLELQKYLVRNKIPYKYENKNKVRAMGLDKPIGSEYTKPDGMVMVKVAKDKWVYKQRYIYEQHYNVSLPDDVYVIFLDQDRNNFDIANLKAISRKEASYMANHNLASQKPNVTLLGLDVARCMIKTKEKSTN